MSNYSNRIYRYNTQRGIRFRVDYAYRSPDGKYCRASKGGFITNRDAHIWQMRELPKLIETLEKPTGEYERDRLKKLIAEIESNGYIVIPKCNCFEPTYKKRDTERCVNYERL